MRFMMFVTVAGSVLMSPVGARAEDTNALIRPPNAIQEIRVQRSEANPLIVGNPSGVLKRNVNGPSVIRVPSWIKDPMGKYYMYFAHHSGGRIRLAYADNLEGPWHIYEPGTLTLEQAEGFHGHIASPDVHVDEDKQQIRMYFHGQTKQGQKTGVAISTNGIQFAASKAILGEFYFRVFQWKDQFYAFAKNGNSGELYRSGDGVTPFESRGIVLPLMRHAAVMIRGNELLLFYSRSTDAPERILVSTVTLTDDWKDWKVSEPIDVIQPEKDYEGIEYPNEPSKSGAGIRVRQLRDPYIFEEDGRTYLFYSIAGEMGIAMAEIKITMKSDAKQ